jgi:oxygen-independent coproporphyrinogen-3 oxidase
VGAYLAGAEAESEHLSQSELYDEYVMVRLRTREGVDLVEVEEKFGADRREYFLRLAERFLSEGVLVQRGQNVAFTEHGWLVSDAVIGELFC